MATVRQYAAWCESRLARLAVSEGLHLGLLSVTQGPLTLTYQVRLLHPSPGALRKLLGLGPALQQALQVSAVRVTEQPGSIAIEIPSPVQRTPTAGDLARATRGKRLCVGFDAQRRPVHVDLQSHGALIWIGPSRRGKTQSMKSSLFALARANGARFRFAILCHERKRQDWQSFENAAGCLGIVTEPAEQEQALEWFAGDLLKQHTSLTFAVVCDDLLNLLARADLAEPLAELASMGAGLGVHLLAGTQEAGAKRGTGGAGVENNATARILYRNSNAAAAARATGQGAEGLQALTGAKGDALLLLDGEPQRVATGLADDRTILQLPQGARWLRPWLRATGSQLPATSDNQAQPAQPATVHTLRGPHMAAPAGDDVPPVAAVAANLFPIDKREPTEREAEVIAELHRAGQSLNALCRLVYGHKDAKAFAWIKEALERAQSAAERAERGAETHTEPEGALAIDMSTAEGLAVVAELQRAGLLPRDTITELIRPQ